MLKISIVGLSWEIENDFVMQVVLSNLTYHIMEFLIHVSIGDIPINSLSFGFGIM